jgi:AcrR family transcriptional regulator
MKETIEKTDKKDHILDVAEKLFSELGFEGASTRHISKEAAVNMAMLNYYFGSKDGLYRAVLERRLGNFRGTLSSLLQENISSWDKVNKCIELYVDRVIGNNKFHRLIHREISLQQRSGSSDFIAETMLRNILEVKRILQEGIDNGSFRPVDVEMTVASILGTKFFIANSILVSSGLLNSDINDPEVLEADVKPRMKAHLKDLLKAHLTNHDL